MTVFIVSYNDTIEQVFAYEDDALEFLQNQDVVEEELERIKDGGGENWELSPHEVQGVIK